MSVLSQVPDEIVDSIDTLPVLPTAVTRLLALTQKDEVSFPEIARVVESDPTLMARTLRLANSPLYSTARRGGRSTAGFRVNRRITSVLGRGVPYRDLFQ